MLFGVFYGVSEAKSRRKSELASSGKIFAWTSAHSCSECGPRYENYIPQKLRKVTHSCDCPHLRLTNPSSCGLLEAFLRPVLGDATVASRSTLAALPETGRGLRGWALLAPCPGWPAHAHCWRESLLLQALAPCSMLGSCPGSSGAQPAAFAATPRVPHSALVADLLFLQPAALAQQRPWTPATLQHSPTWRHAVACTLGARRRCPGPPAGGPCTALPHGRSRRHYHKVRQHPAVSTLVTSVTALPQRPIPPQSPVAVAQSDLGEGVCLPNAGLLPCSKRASA